MKKFNMRIYALLVGIFCHLSFGVAIGLMFFSIFHGLQISPPVAVAPWSFIINLLLIIQFPILHSLLLHKSGSYLLDYLSPKSIAKQMRTTIFSIISAWQLILLFSCWQSTDIIVYKSAGWYLYLHSAFYLASWLYLALSIREAGASVQTGFIGWYSVFSKQTPKYPKLPTSGLHGQCRHPIYLAFALILLCTPTISMDILLLNLIWVPYCFLGPILKELRLSQYNPKIYPSYREETPYMLPKCLNIKFSKMRNSNSQNEKLQNT